MNRIICDICGSEYSATEERCPICNYPRQGTEAAAAAAAGEAVRTKVKGGRFSNKNVKKRMKAQKKAAAQTGKDPNKPLWIVIVILLIAILLVSLYIGVRFFRGWGGFQGGGTTVPQTTVPTQTTLPPEIPCEGIVFTDTVLDLENKGEQLQLDVKLLPQNTTDSVTYTSADNEVVTVSETGLLTAVGSGQTTVTITCGEFSKVCTVVCWFVEDTTAPAQTTAPTEPEPTQPAETQPPETQPKPTEAAVLKLDPEDASCFTLGETFTVYVRLGNATINRSKVTWSTSDPKIATVENGVVTATGKGTATITAEYNGQKAYCTVRCRFEDTSASKPTEGEQEETKAPSWKVSHSDVSISVGETFRLTVKNSDGKTADAIWTMSIDGVVSIEGKTVTGRAPGTVTLSTTVDGETFTCIVRVK